MKKYSLRMLTAAVLMTMSVHTTADDWRHGSASFALIGDAPYGAAVEVKSTTSYRISMPRRMCASWFTPAM